MDITSLENLLQRVGRLAEDLPEVAELDLNPVLAGPTEVLGVDVKLRLAPVTGEPDPYVRSMGEPTPASRRTDARQVPPAKAA